MSALEKLFEPSVSHRFLTTLFFKNIPSPLDIRFQRITGLGRELQVSEHRGGGENEKSLYLPDRIKHPPLVLERGVMVVTPLTMIFNEVLSNFDPQYVDLVIMLLNQNSLPVCTWTVTDALPVNWQTGDLDATSNTVLINRLELAYSDMQWLGVKA
ncbi:phage tail protein [Pseudomonas chlororaphis]|uniref:phage tail protein n=1 Tax=Pseudomonas chlororaphis TaxID=587753 RepID=UPI000789CF21|nr:phage tail protein [Pseudomonas chlororaphis]AMS13813.1 phage tail protein [Pseudomonas chlororaphis]